MLVTIDKMKSGEKILSSKTDEHLNTDVSVAFNQQIDHDSASAAFDRLRSYLNQQVLGQEKLIERLLVALLADGHLLVEGPPGLAKTRAIKALSQGMQVDFQRLQFTPDMLPADLTGSDIFIPEEGKFVFRKGPLFHNLILADEVNRAPAKVQAALLEAMGERQISAGASTYSLPALFLVMATQNPIEQEGTYPLPEAQLDRFMLHVLVDYPDRKTTRKILALTREEVQSGKAVAPPPNRMQQVEVVAARQALLNINLADTIIDYIAALVDATRNPDGYSAELRQWLLWGASPRAAIAIERCARALAWLAGRDYVSPEDVQNIAPDALRHRIIVDYAAQARGVNADRCIDLLLNSVPAP